MQATERKELQPSEHLQAGDTLGRYQLLCPIARGGMGQVWAARQTGRLGLPKLVAIKTALPFESKDYHQVQEYLFDEAQVASSIDHPNVCKILELGQDRDVLFIAMEWLNGVPLAALVSKVPHRRLAYRMAAYLVAQACGGLHAAHELTDDDGVHLEVVHRDATPHNFMITCTGELKVMDFGIAKAKNQQHQATQQGELKGKISYLAPEQIRGGRVDRRTDIFALGCVLYVVTVGKGAFNPDADQDAGHTMLKILDGDYTRPSLILADYPPELEAIVARALTTAPAERFQTAEEMRIALEVYLGDGSRSVSREDVTSLLGEYCGPAIEQRRSEIRMAQKMFDSQSGQMRSGAYPVAEKAFELGPPLPLAPRIHAENPPNWTRSSPLAPTVRPPKHNRRPLWLVLSGLGLLFASLGVHALRRPTPDRNVHHALASSLEPQPVPQVTVNAQRTDIAPPASAQVAKLAASQDVSAVATARVDSVSKTSHKTSGRHAAAPPSAATVSRAEEASPLTPANSQFTQTLSRKPPRHAIDESDPFEK